MVYWGGYNYHYDENQKHQDYKKGILFSLDNFTILNEHDIG